MKDNHRKLVLMATILYLIVLVLSWSVSGSSDSRPTWLSPGAAIFVAQVGFILIPALLFVLLGRLPFREYFKLKRLSLGHAAACCLIGLLCWPMFNFLSVLSTLLVGLFWPERLSAAANAAGAAVSPWALFLMISFVAPLCEEALFRGVLFSVYEKRLGFRTIWLVSILFAMIHLSYDQVLGAAFIGFVAGWLVYHTRSLWSGVLVHAGCNLVAGLMLLAVSLATAGASEPTGLQPAGSDPLGLLLASALVWGAAGLTLLIPVILLLRRLGKRYPAPAEPVAIIQEQAA